ncbi:MAG: hypothetical protein QG610_748 [Euryarchaeota archaeon]|nr:hypothetical protein [Euryarchaeota archaeon]
MKAQSFELIVRVQFISLIILYVSVILSLCEFIYCENLNQHAF